MQQPDKLTQTGGSLDAQNNFIRRFYKILCPCLSQFKDAKQSQDRNNPDYFASDSSNRSSTQARQYELHRKNTHDISPYLSFKLENMYSNNDNDMSGSSYQNNLKGHQSRSFGVNQNEVKNAKKERDTARQTVDLRQMKFMTYSSKKQNLSFPISKYREGELHLIGKHNKNLLAEISTVRLEPSPTAVQKQFLSKNGDTSSKREWRNLDSFWNLRYYYFQKFDQGIQIDQESLGNLTPEAVSDYIAGKCYDCKVVMDAFSGIGHNATKLGTVCEKVICVEEEAKKYNCLINNVKCYEIYNVELFLKPFLEISLKSRVDAVLVHPYLSNEHYSLQSFCESKNFKPHLSQVIKKTLEISNNLILLLPPNISLKDICYEISKHAQSTSSRFCSCSVKIEKIYFKGEFQYVAVFFGWNVQQQIKINSELECIYKMLRGPDEKGFYHKKLIKYLREKYGMIRLLNIVSESISIERQSLTEIQKLIEFIKQRKLIVDSKLSSLLLNEERTPRKKQTNEDFSSMASNSPDTRIISQPYSYTPKLDQLQEKIQEQLEQHEQQPSQQEQQETVSQRTQSFYSSVSGFSAFKKRDRTITSSQKKTQNEKNNSSDHNLQRESNNSSIVIKKIIDDNDESMDNKEDTQSKSPASPTRVGTEFQDYQKMKYRYTLNTNPYAEAKNKRKNQKDMLASDRNGLRINLIQK